MKTICSHCIFYKKQEKECRLGLLAKAKSTLTQDGHEVSGLCRSCRNIYWLEKNQNLNQQELSRKVLEENKIKYDIIIGFDIRDEVDNLLKTISSINNFEIKPQTIIIASNRHYLLNQSLWADLSIRYSELKFLVNFCGYDSYESLLDFSLNKVTSEFVLNTVCGCSLQNDVIIAMNEEINTPSRFLSYYKDSNCYISEAGILRHAILNKPKDTKTLDYIKENMNHIGTIYELA